MGWKTGNDYIFSIRKTLTSNNDLNLSINRKQTANQIEKCKQPGCVILAPQQSKRQTKLRRVFKKDTTNLKINNSLRRYNNCKPLCIKHWYLQFNKTDVKNTKDH